MYKLMNKSFEYFWNRIFHQIIVFFQLRWLLAFLLRFDNIKTILLKTKKVKKAHDGSIRLSFLFSPYHYDFTLRGFQLYMVVGILPIGLYLTKDIKSTLISVVVCVIVSVIPVVVFNHRFLMKDNQIIKYYNLFEQDSLSDKRKWGIITLIFISFLSVIFVFNWILFIKMHT